MNNNPMKKQLQILLDDKTKLFGLLYPYVLIIGITLGAYFVLSLNDIVRQNVPPKIVDTTAQETDLKLVEAKSVPAVDIKTVSQPSQELLKLGKETFQKLCVSCHGENGAGIGPASTGLNPAPRNFTSGDNWKNGSSITGIFTTLQEGFANSAMVAYDYLTTNEKFALAHYIRNEFVKNAPVETDDDIAALDQTYNLSAGTETPAQIPVAAAMNMMDKEHSNEASIYTKLKQKIKNETVEGAILFDRVTNNYVSVISLLVKSNSWRSSPSSLNSFLQNNVGRLGFKRTVFSLSVQELDTLYNYLKNNIVL